MGKERLEKYRKHIEPLFGRMFVSAYRLTGSREDAEDLTQETFIKAFRAIDRFDSDSAPAAWLYTIMRNTFLNDLRHKKSRETLLFDESLAERLPDERAENSGPVVMDEKLQATLDSIPEEMRSVLVAREIAQLSYDEIASSFNLPLGTVKSRINRAREMLRERWLGRDEK
ncbi:MAG: sigma-70 family RNA polymerase sigma factor [Nitrospinae bacterium]|nr:sigma-70 family RNA polymerase sigma factor [Nitrospinota bacterium]